MNAPKKQSSSVQRAVIGYLKPKNFDFFMKYVGDKEMSESQAVNDAVAALQEKLNPNQKIYSKNSY